MADIGVNTLDHGAVDDKQLAIKADGDERAGVVDVVAKLFKDGAALGVGGSQIAVDVLDKGGVPAAGEIDLKANIKKLGDTKVVPQLHFAVILVKFASSKTQ